MLFGVIDDKGGEKPKDMCNMLMEGDQLKFEHTNRGSKPIDLLLHLFEHDHMKCCIASYISNFTCLDGVC